MYNFQRIASGKDKGAYYHANFLRGRPELCHQIVRSKVNVGGSSNNNNNKTTNGGSSSSTTNRANVDPIDPDFDSMEPMLLTTRRHEQHRSGTMLVEEHGVDKMEGIVSNDADEDEEDDNTTPPTTAMSNHSESSNTMESMSS